MTPPDPSPSDPAASDAFALLGLAPRAALDPEEVEQAFRLRAAGAHPDAAGADADGTRFAALGAARDALRSPARRLGELLVHLQAEASSEPGAARRTVTLSAELNRLFPVVGSALDEARAVIARRDAAGSDLARALVTPDLLRARQRLIAAQEQLRDCLRTLEAELPALDEVLAAADIEHRDSVIQRIDQLQGQFACLGRWQDQLRQQTAACMF